MLASNLTVAPQLSWERISINGTVEKLTDNLTLNRQGTGRAELVLSFAELLTSSGGVYRCVAALEKTGFNITAATRNITIIVASEQESIPLQNPNLLSLKPNLILTSNPKPKA